MCVQVPAQGPAFFKFSDKPKVPDSMYENKPFRIDDVALKARNAVAAAPITVKISADLPKYACNIVAKDAMLALVQRSGKTRVTFLADHPIAYAPLT